MKMDIHWCGIQVKAALIDFCQQDCDSFKELLISGFKKEGMFLNIVSFSNLEEMFLSAKNCDIYFIELEASGVRGFKILERLRMELAESIFILVGDDGGCMQEAFYHRPFAFIRKGEFKKDVAKTLFYLKREFLSREKKAVLFDGKKEHIVRTSEISYCHSVEHYICLHYVEKKRKMDMLRMKLSDAEIALEPFGFARIHRNYLVNLYYVEGLRDRKIILEEGDTALSISRSMFKDVKRVVEKWKVLHGSQT